MKKILLIVFSLIFISANAQTLRAGISEEYIPNGFFGSWGVISKLISSNNPDMFNYESKDIWTLHGYGDILILENLESGARSEIKIKDKNTDGKTLKFEREKVVKKQGAKVVYKETVSFLLMGNNFSGQDNFIVERYDSNNNLVKKDEAKYRVEGVKISGTSSAN